MGNGILSQEEINALLQGTMEPNLELEIPPSEVFISEMEKDALGEIGNISMGTAATTLSFLLGKKVQINTPKVDVTNSMQVIRDHPIPSVICDVKYKSGLEGSNLLILSQLDGAVIVDLMMGGEGKNPTPELSDLQVSGIGEAMNQMMGSAATSMSTMFNAMVEIAPPNIVLNDFSTDQDIIRDFLSPADNLVRISFRMVVEGVIDSILIQVIPLSVAKGMVNKLVSAMSSGVSAAPAAQQQQTPISVSYQAPPPPPAYETSPYPTGADYPPYGMVQKNMQTPVQPVQFAPLQPEQQVKQPENLNLILDVPLQISVELGKAKKTIKEILEMGPGSVIELDRLAGESVDMIVNGKLIAKCEVVVVNETFGIRITDIVQPLERMYTLK
jgi:flagellar motor switch protein FliN/FliY